MYLRYLDGKLQHREELDDGSGTYWSDWFDVPHETSGKEKCPSCGELSLGSVRCGRCEDLNNKVTDTIRNIASRSEPKPSGKVRPPTLPDGMVTNISCEPEPKLKKLWEIIKPEAERYCPHYNHEGVASKAIDEVMRVIDSCEVRAFGGAVIVKDELKQRLEELR